MQCPQCKQFKVISFKTQLLTWGASALVIAPFTTIFFFAYAPLIFLPIITAGVGILMIISAFLAPKEYTCQNCNYQWKEKIN